MSDGMLVSIDAMGGDTAPLSVIEGLDYYVTKMNYGDDRFVLHGNEKQISDTLKGRQRLSELCEIVHTDEVIDMDMPPVQAMRRFRKSSMRLAVKALKQDRCDFCVSAGNTGALMAISKTVLRMMSGLERPAICASFPVKNGGTFAMLDLGADVSADAKRLTEFAAMGATYGKIMTQISKPRVAVLNIGTESGKGRPELLEAANSIEKTFGNSINFVGFVEGTQIFGGDVDVVVTDGFTGNNVLKTIEGLSQLMIGGLLKNFNTSAFGALRLLAAREPLRKFSKVFDPRLYNGAVLVGLRGIVVKSHGRSDPLAYACAVRRGRKLAQGNFISDLNSTIAPFIASMSKPGAPDSANDVETLLQASRF